MKIHSPVFASFLVTLSFFGHQAAHAGTPAGKVTQLSGFIMALKANGALKVLATQSVVETGDTLVSEENTYVRLDLADGRQAVLGPQTRLTIASATTLSLATGQLQVLGPAQPGTGRLSIAAGETTVDAGAASFNLFYSPDPATAIAQRAYAGASLAAATTSVRRDAGSVLPVWEKVAQGPVPQLPGGGRVPGLYVQVLDGQITLNNRGGTSNFSAGQFGYTRSNTTPPVMVPSNPAIRFTPPTVFSSSAPTAGSSGSATGSGKSAAVDCEVR
ncbi:MAG: hypothetical protein Q8M96_13365 [Rubrivivax sp.]|nr:hypothetical protein [Rubrivivax sp.]